MKIGRNVPCPCGSGKKFKKCHLGNESGIIGRPVVTKLMNPSPEIENLRVETEKKINERRKLLELMGLYIDFVIPTEFKGKKIWALGSELYPRNNPNETFHEFIIDVLRLELGKDWWEAQIKLPENKQHFIMKCFLKHYEWKKKNMLPENKHGELWAVKPDGYSRALVSLAFDVCSLIHAVHLPELFISKLKKYQEYQAVRYEIAVAALFARMGYKIEFLDEIYAGQDSPPKHCEFIAIDVRMNEKIAVEVKSKTRDGVLHQTGDFNPEKELKSSISKLYRHAMKQKLDKLPFIIFIDMNLPLSDKQGPENSLWLPTVTKMIDQAAFSAKDRPSPTNALVFTNYSYHYGSDNETPSGEFFLEIGINPENPIKKTNFQDVLVNVLGNYGSVPNLDMKVER